jgi:hypothetical protein
MGGIVVRGALAHAQMDGGAPGQGGPADSAPAHAVDVTIVAGGEEADPLMDTVRELFGRLGLSVSGHLVANPEQTPDGGPRSPGLSVQIDLASRYDALIVVRSDRTEVRRTISRDASPSIVREEIADAVRSAVESQLLSDEARAAAPPPAPIATNAPPPLRAPPVLEAPAPSADDRWFALDLTTLAGLGYVAPGPLVSARVGGGVVLGSRRGHRPSVTVTGSYLVPFTSSLNNGSSSPNVTSSTDMVSFRAIPAIEVLHTSSIALHVGAGGGVDAIALGHTTTQPAPPLKIMNEGDQTKVDPILTAQATVDVGLTPGVAFTLMVGSDLDLRALRYVVQDQGAEQPLLVPNQVRPFALGGFTFTAVGAGLFAPRSAP